MTVEQLKERVEKYRAGLKQKEGLACVFSETGPASMGLIDALVAALEAQEARIQALENRPDGGLSA
jgi:hypothetical protein